MPEQGLIARLGVTVVAVLALSGGPAAQAPPATFSASSELVVLHVAVTDQRGRPVTTLPPSAFQVMADGHSRPVRFASRADGPATVGLVVDGSGSMWTLRERAVDAVAAFAGAGRPDDEFFGLVFHDTVQPVLPPDAPFTADPRVLESSFRRALQARGRTALYDGVDQGLRYAARGTRQRKVLVVVSDGGDNASQATLADLEQRAQSSNVTIYVVELKDDTSPWRERARGSRDGLSQLVTRTGGLLIPPVKASRLVEGLRRVADEIHSAYLLGFEPAPGASDGQLHAVRVTAADAAGRRLQVQSRTAYRAGAAP